MLETRAVLAENLIALLSRKKAVSGGGARLTFSKEIGVADGTLGRIKYGTGNPTLDVITSIAAHFGIEPWRLLAPRLGENVTSEGSVTGDAHLSPHVRAAISAIVRMDSSGSSSPDFLINLARTIESLTMQNVNTPTAAAHQQRTLMEHLAQGEGARANEPKAPDSNAAEQRAQAGKTRRRNEG